MLQWRMLLTEILKPLPGEESDYNVQAISNRLREAVVDLGKYPDKLGQGVVWQRVIEYSYGLNGREHQSTPSAVLQSMLAEEDRVIFAAPTNGTRMYHGQALRILRTILRNYGVLEK